MTRTIDLETWNRAQHYHFYKHYDQPCFNITADVAVTDTLAWCRRTDHSFFLVSLFTSLTAVNRIEAFRYRMRGDRVVVHEVIHAGSTILNEDRTFGFCYFEYDPDPAVFLERAAERLRDYHRRGNDLSPQEGRDDLVYYSVIPWISFTSFAHASDAAANRSIPKLVMGKYREKEGGWQMPVSVEVHHALMDGWHVGQFFQTLAALDGPPIIAE